MKATQHRRERIQEQNRELAVKTCEQQPKFEEMKSELRQKSTKVDELRDSYITKYEELSKCRRVVVGICLAGSTPPPHMHTHTHTDIHMCRGEG